MAYRFIGTASDDRSGSRVTSGDFDGDDVADYAIGAYGTGSTGVLYLVAGSDLPALDLANGPSADGIIDLLDVADAAGSHVISGEDPGGRFGISAGLALADADGDGRDDVLVGAVLSDMESGAAYLIDSQNLVDFASNGAFNISELTSNRAAFADSYRFIGQNLGDRAGQSIDVVGDLTGDGVQDIAIGSYWADPNGVDQAGELSILSGAAFAAADGNNDGTIVLGTNIANQADSYLIEGTIDHGKVGVSVAPGGDPGGNGHDAILVGQSELSSSQTAPGTGYVIDGADLASLAGSDGILSIADAPTGANSYGFEGATVGDQTGFQMLSVGDIATDRDDWANSYRIVGADPGDKAGSVNAGVADMFGALGKAGLMIGAPGTGPAAGTTYILGAADLLRQGTDGEVDLGEVLLCFAHGTRIAVPGGSRAVEALRPGDLVETLDRGPQPVVWTGQMVEAARCRRAPVVIRAGALGSGVPARDLWLSPQHRVTLSGKVVARMFGVMPTVIENDRYPPPAPPPRPTTNPVLSHW
jgi:hypothetical protein